MTNNQEEIMPIASNLHMHDPSGSITTKSTAPDPTYPDKRNPVWLETEWSKPGGIDRHTTIFTEHDAIRIHTHEIPSLIEKLQRHLESINEHGGLPR
jgi:hypothetical protein